jgi:hypothetical protein
MFARSIIMPPSMTALPATLCPPAASGDFETLGTGKAHGIGNIGRVDAPGDERWTLVDQAVVNGPHLVVAGILGPYDLSGELLTERVH